MPLQFQRLLAELHYCIATHKRCDMKHCTVQDFIEQEGNIELQKKRQDETNERKNAVEAYVYMLRNQLSDALSQYVTEQEQSSISNRLTETEVRTIPTVALGGLIARPHNVYTLHSQLSDALYSTPQYRSRAASATASLRQW